MKKTIYLLSTALVIVFLSSYSNAQQIPDSKGTDFWLTFMPNFHNNSGAVDPKFKYGDSLYIFVTASQPAVGQINYRDRSGNPHTHNFSITDISKIHTFKVSYWNYELKGNSSSAGPSGANQNETIAPQSFHVTTDTDVTVYAHIQAEMTSESFIVLPTDALGQEYYILTYGSDDDYGSGSSSNTPSQFSIVATEDDTEITITPSTQTAANGTSIQNIDLMEGDVYLVQARLGSNNYRDLTGTRIKSDKPVAVFAGHRRATIPVPYNYGQPSRDCLVEQMPPIESWGKDAILTTYPQPSENSEIYKDIFRIMSAYSNTEIYLNGNLLTTLNSGQFFEGELLDGAFVEASNPIMVMQYKRTSLSTNPNPNSYIDSDPFMMIIPQIEQFDNFYRFINVQAWDYQDGFGKVYNFQYVTIVAPNSTLNTVKIDGNPVNVNAFRNIPNSGYSYGWFSVSDGTHTAEAEEDIGIYVYGYGPANSYGYFGGMNFKRFDYTPPEITSVLDCYKIEGMIYDTTANDTKIRSVSAPIEEQRNVDLTIEQFTPLVSQVAFSAQLQDIYQDGRFAITAVDSFGLDSTRYFDIPGFTIKSVLQESDRTPITEDTVRIEREFCYNFTIHNYGSFSQVLTEGNIKAGSPEYTINTGFPLTIEPGDSAHIEICFYSDSAGIFLDTLYIKNDCAGRDAMVVQILARGDTDDPQISTVTDPCGLEFDLSIYDSLITDYGLMEIEIVESVNCNIEHEEFDSKLVRYNIKVEDPYQDAYYKIIVTDSADHVTIHEKAIPGFTISMPALESNDFIDDFGAYSIGGLICDTIDIYNYGNFTKTFTKVVLERNHQFSVPQSQLPLIIEPGDTARLEVCYNPDLAESSDYDTLKLVYWCLDMPVLLKGLGDELVSRTETRCGDIITLEFKSKPGNYFLAQSFPNPATDIANIDFGLPVESNVELSLYDIYGKKQLTLMKGGLKAGTHRAVIDTGDLPQGMYYYILNVNNTKLSKSLIISK